MKSIVCPHCKSRRVMRATAPRDVVVVLSCPSCRELSVIFRNKIIPLERRVLEDGGIEELTAHLAKVVAEFIDSGMLPFIESRGRERGEETDDEALFEPMAEEETAVTGITDREVERFVRFDLKAIDDPAYFRRHFG